MKSELEEIQYKRLYFEYDEPLQDIRYSTLRLFLWGSLLLIILIAIFGFIIKFPSILTADCMIKTSNKEQIFSYDHTLFIEEKFVRPNDTVKKGDPLLCVSSSKINELVLQLKTLKQEYMAMKQKQTLLAGVLKYQISLENKLLLNNINKTRNNIDNTNKNWNLKRKLSTSEMELIKKEDERAEYLWKNKVISAAEFEQMKLKSIEKRKQFEAETYQKNITLNELNAIIMNDENKRKLNESQLIKEGILDTTYLKTNQQNQELIHTALSTLIGDYEIIENKVYIVASNKGIVNYFHKGDKEVPAEIPLLRISSIPNSYYALGTVTSAYVHRVHQGAMVNINLDAYPYTEFGSIKAKVTNCAKVPDSKGLYSFEMTIEELPIKKMELVYGMTGRAQIHLVNRSLWQHLFYKLKQKVYPKI